MDGVKLSRDASNLLLALYKAYKKERKRGDSKDEAKIFGGSLEIQQEILRGWSLIDINDACLELDREDLLLCVPGDDGIQIAFLTNRGIEFVENRFTYGAKAVWEFLKEILSVIPFLGG